MRKTSLRRLFASFYFLSGAAGLIYEVLWTRLATLQMGHTVGAVSIVLAAFMGGLAVGAWLAGRLTVRSEHRLYAYAALELMVAGLAIALPGLLHHVTPVMAWAYADATAPARFAAVRFVLSLSLLALPAAAMGATFPIAASWFASRADARPDAARWAAADAGMLYAANTAGAAIGAIGAGFWLIPTFGIRGTTWVGVLLNVAAALGSSWMARAESQALPGSAPSPEPLRRSKPRVSRSGGAQVAETTSSPALAWTAAAVCGCAALIYEVASTRLLALIIGPTTYAFATMAAAFITGIALGSAAGTRLSRRTSQPTIWMATMLVVTAVSAALMASFAASHLPLVVASQVATAGTTFESLVVREAVSVGLLMFPMTFALGVAFPLALAMASSGAAEVGRDSARVYTANTLGAIAGSLAAGFVLIPRFGLHATFISTSIAATVAGAAVGATVLLRRKGKPRPGRLLVSGLLLTGAVAAIAMTIPRWDRNLLVSGGYKYAPYIAADNQDAFVASLRAGRLEYYKEGASATVSVRRLGGSLALAIDGKVDASNAGDMLTQRLLGVLPVLLHPDPRELCIIGHGSGVTAGSALATGLVHHADIVEISPEVVEASKLFSKENGDVLHAAGVRLIVGDGRSHLQFSKRRYDVIISEPSNPWMAGIAALFTREFFEAVRARLTSEGIFCQWAHTYDMSAGDLTSIARTFAGVFPQGTLWLVGDGDLLLIGTAGADIDKRLEGIAERCCSGAVPAALADVGVDPSAARFQLLSLFAGGPAELARYGDGAQIQTDDRMALEFSAPRWIYSKTTNVNTAAIRALTEGSRLPEAVASALKSADAGSWAARGTMDLKAQAYTSAYEHFRRAAALDNSNVDALRGASDSSVGAGMQSDQRQWLQSLVNSVPTNIAARVELSRVLASSGDFDGAIASASEAIRRAPDDPVPAEQLASVFADLGDAARLESLANALVARFPQRDSGRFYAATALALRGRWAEAADLARIIVAKNPDHAKAQDLLGAACASAGQTACARAAFEASIRSNPRDSAPYVNLGLLSIQTGRPNEGADYFAEALVLDPTSTAAKDGLTQLRGTSGIP